ncbi:MAG: hypothetical protein U5L76_00165 [Patescibacteria group bacterium]|nr:hypothetical protein [Patescibacteria group bacterium]
MNLFKKTSNLLNKPEKSVILGSFILLLILVILFIAGYYYSPIKKTSSDDNQVSSRILGAVDYKEGEPSQAELRIRKSYSGRVKEVKENYIIFEAKYIRDNNIVLSTLKANLNTDTSFYKKNMAIIYKYGHQGESEALNSIERKDLKKGDRVLVYAKENIKYKEEFMASRIEKIN